MKSKSQMKRENIQQDKNMMDGVDEKMPIWIRNLPKHPYKFHETIISTKDPKDENDFKEAIKVIEYSAYQELKERYEILLADVESYGLNRGS